jgi:hypothetical protein
MCCWGIPTFCPLDNSSDQYVLLKFPPESDIEVLSTIGVHQICNQFWQYSLCNIYQLWQPPALHQVLLKLRKD